MCLPSPAAVLLVLVLPGKSSEKVLKKPAVFGVVDAAAVRARTGTTTLCAGADGSASLFVEWCTVADESSLLNPIWTSRLYIARLVCSYRLQRRIRSTERYGMRQRLDYIFSAFVRTIIRSGPLQLSNSIRDV